MTTTELQAWIDKETFTNIAQVYATRMGQKRMHGTGITKIYPYWEIEIEMLLNAMIDMMW